MALKDWTELESAVEGNKLFVLGGDEEFDPSKEYKYRIVLFRIYPSKKYKFILFKAHKEIKSKTFKNKSEALKSAKAYMRSH